MNVDISETRQALAEALNAPERNEAALKSVRRLCRLVLLDAWRSVAMGDVGRPSEWSDALRSLILGEVAPEYQATVAHLSEALSLAVSAMPRPLAASERPRTDTERHILTVLAGSDRPLARGEIRERLPPAGRVTPQAVGQALERMEYRDLVVRRREKRQGAAEASLWQISPVARHLVTASSRTRAFLAKVAASAVKTRDSSEVSSAVIPRLGAVQIHRRVRKKGRSAAGRAPAVARKSAGE